eukprot:jgi/Phyca11/535966/estExt2_fgenesh1_pg.C_PHYCAscaffold_440035
MRSTNSLKMVVIVVTLNMMDMLLALHGMNRRSRVALANRAIQQKRQRQQRSSARCVYHNERRPTEIRSMAERKSRYSSAAETRKQNTVAVNQTLQLLFNNEYLGLIAYVQCIMPLIYMAYIMVILEMPNRQFYLNESDLEHREGLAQRFTVIAAFVVLQMAILIGLHVFVATRFGVSTLYQVAFVLETHARLWGFCWNTTVSTFRFGSGGYTYTNLLVDRPWQDNQKVA